MKVHAHQPNFLPWVGFWNKVVQTDVGMLLVDVQYSRGDYINRVKLDGQWLTLPVQGAKHDSKIMDCKVNLCDVRRVAKTIRQVLCNKKNPHADRLFYIVQYLERTEIGWLSALNMTLLQLIADALEIEPVWTISEPGIGDTKTEQLQSRLGVFPDGTEYYSGAAGRTYLRKELWTKGPVFVQKVKEGTASETILSVIARHDKPLDIIRNCATWETL